MKTEIISYVFNLDDDLKKKSYDFEFDSETMRLIHKNSQKEYEWTKLEFNKCEHCPLDETTHPRCPVAKNIAEVVDEFKEEKSFEKSTVGIVTKNRTYMKKTSLQEGLFGVVGLIMATSGCPHMEFLRPMAKFHLPFSTPQETVVRSISMFMLREYFMAKNLNKDFKLDLSKLDKNYENVNTVNRGIIKRIQSISKGDADLNAMMILDSFCTMLAFEIQQDLGQIEKLFK